MYGQSAIADNFFNCSVEYFKPNPDRILFNLVFKVSEPNKVTGRDVVTTFMQVAPTVRDQGYNYFHIGGLLLRKPDSNKKTTSAATLTTLPPVTMRRIMSVTPQKPQTINIIYNGTQVKLNYRLFEESYTERLLQNTSREFQKFQTDFCGAISSSFLKSHFAQRFYNCHISSVQPFPPSVQFGLYLSTPLSDSLISNVTQVIDTYVPSVYIQQKRYLNASGYYLHPEAYNHTQTHVNITEQLYRERQNMSPERSPITAPPTAAGQNIDFNPRVVYHDATMASYEFGLKDFAITKDLLNITSPSFVKVSGDFCSEVRKLMNSSQLNSEYWLCQIESFNSSSQSVKFYLVFVSPMVESLKNETLHILSPKFPPTDSYHIASLNLSGQNKMVELKPVNISDFLPANENTPMLSGLSPVPNPQYPGMLNQTVALSHSGASTDAVVLPLKFNLHNFTYVQDLVDATSETFKSYAKPLCQSIGRYFRHTHLSQIFKGCQVEAFKEIPTSVSFHLIFGTDSTTKLRESVLKILSMSASHRLEDGQELIKVGNLFLIWKETFEQKDSWPMQSAQSQNIFPDFQQRINSPNYIPVTLPNTVTRSGNRRSTFARAINTHPQLEIRGTTASRSVINHDFDKVVNAQADLTADVSYELHNLVYTYDMANETSITFQNKTSDFCKDIDNIYQSSNISSFYRKCSVLSIKPDPPSVTFRLVFTHKQSKVPSDIIQVLEHRAPQLNKNGKSVLHVGDLFLVWRNYSLVLSTTPEGQAGTSMWAAGNNPPVSVGPQPVRDAVEIISSVKLYNFSYDPQLADPTSNMFSKFNKDFCRNLQTFYHNNSQRILDCDVLEFRRDPSFVSYRLLFASDNTSLPQVMDNIVNLIPNNNGDSVKLVNVGGLSLIWHNRTDKMRQIAWKEKTTFFSQKQTGLPWVCSSNPCGSRLTMDVRLFNFTMLPELQHRHGAQFKKITEKFCNEVSGIIDRSSLLRPIGYCTINKFGHNPPTVSFQLILRELPSKQLKKKIENVFEMSGYWKTNGQRQKLLHLGDLFLQWPKRTMRLEPFFLRHDGEKSLSVPSDNFGELTVNIQVPVGNLSFSASLFDPKSDLFKSSAQDLCKKISTWIHDSPKSQEFYGCKVLGYSPNPNMVRFQLTFRTQNLDAGAKKELEERLQFSSMMVKRNGQLVLPTGKYYLYWPRRRVSMYFMRHATVNVTPSVTDQSMKSLPNDRNRDHANVTQYHRISLRLLTPNVTSAEMMESQKTQICQRVAAVYQKSSLADMFRSCQLKFMSSKEGSAVVEILLVFYSRSSDTLVSNVEKIFYESVDKRRVGKGSLLSIGDIYFTWQNRTVSHVEMSNAGVNTDHWLKQTSDTRVTTIASLELRTFNMSTNPDLRNTSSFMFKRLEREFCAQMSTIFRHSYLHDVYTNCQLIGFSSDFQSLKFHLSFNTQSIGKLQTNILQVLQDRSPTVFREGKTLLHIGGLFFSWDGKYIRIFSANDPNIGTTETAPTTIHRTVFSNTTHYVSEICEISFMFRLYNFTYTAELSDVHSRLLQNYSSRLCSDLFSVYQNSSLKDILLNCTLVAFGNQPNTMKFSLLFNKSSVHDLQRSVLNVLEHKAPHLTIDHLDILYLGGLHLIWQGYTIHTQVYNSTYARSPVTIVILYEAILANLTIGVFNLTYTPQLKDTTSQTFLRYESSVCGGFNDIFKNSGSVWPLRSCNMKSVQPEPPALNVHLVFVKPMADEQGILTQMNISTPHIRINGLDLIRLGDVIVNLDQAKLSMKPVNLSTATTWNSSIPSDALVTQYTPLDPDGANTQRRQVVLLHDATMAILTLEVLNMTFIPDFGNRSSQAFLDIQHKLCSNITRIFQNSLLAPHYYMCNVNKLSSIPFTVTIHLTFVAPYEASLLRNVTHILNVGVPHKSFEGRDALWIDNILLDWGSCNISMQAVNFSSILQNQSGQKMPKHFLGLNATKDVTIIKYEATLVNLTYALANFRYTNDLANSNSEQFQNYAIQFCNEVDKLLGTSVLASAYHGCRLRKFSPDPNAVTFQLLIRSPESSMLIQNITALLEKNAKRKSGQQTWQLQLGGLSLNQNTAQVSSSVFNITGSDWPTRSAVDDGWLVRLALRPYNMTYREELMNTSSPVYQEYSQTLCNAIDRMYAGSNFSKRYVGCEIEAFRDKPFKTIFRLTFRQRDDLVPDQIVSVLRRFRDSRTNAAAIGNIYYWMDNMSLAYEPTNVPETTVMNITFAVINPPYDRNMENPMTKEFQTLAKPFCNYLDKIYKEEGRFSTYQSCEVTAFKRNPNSISFNLLFSGQVDPSLRGKVISILIEKAPREAVRGQIALKVGGLLIFEKSVTTDLTHRSENNLPWRPETVTQGSTRSSQSKFAFAVAPATPQMAPEIKKNQKNKSSDPCAPNKNGDYFPHPTSCTMFIQCAFGRSHVIPCKTGLVYDPVIKNCLAHSKHADCTNKR